MKPQKEIPNVHRFYLQLFPLMFATQKGKGGWRGSREEGKEKGRKKKKERNVLHFVWAAVRKYLEDTVACYPFSAADLKGVCDFTHLLAMKKKEKEKQAK